MWVGTCDNPEIVSVSNFAFNLREGCDVYLTQTDEGYVGSTEGKECVSSLSGASYATSEVTLTPQLLQSWDQGFNASDVQVWGATAGPYNFDRLTEIVDPATWESQVQSLL